MRRFNKDIYFIIGFAGGGFLVEIVTQSFPRCGSILIGALIGLLYMELNDLRDNNLKQVVKAKNHSQDSILETPNKKQNLGTLRGLQSTEGKSS